MPKVGWQGGLADRDRVTLVTDRHLWLPVLRLGRALLDDLRPRRRNDMLHRFDCLRRSRRGVSESAEGGERAEHQHGQGSRERGPGPGVQAITPATRADMLCEGIDEIGRK